MEHYHLSKRFLRYTINFVPSLMIAIYAFALAYDLSSVLYTLDYNNSIVNLNMDNGYIKEVSSENRVYGDNSLSIDCEYGSLLFDVYLAGNNLFMLEASDGDVFVSDFSLVESSNWGSDSAELTFNGNTMSTPYKTQICGVFLENDGTLLIDFEDDNYSFKLDSISELSLDLRSIDSCKFTLRGTYEVKTDGLEIVFSNILPTSNTYYDLSSNTLVQNTNSDFSKNFILGSNLLVLFCVTTLFNILLILCYKAKKLPDIINMRCIWLNISFYIVVVILVVLVNLLL